MKRDPIDIFDEWADLDKDFGMEKNHKSSVKEMLAYVLDKKTPYSFIDAGCGNGWVVRSVEKNPLCKKAIGVDGSKKMIQKATKLDPSGSYIYADLMSWVPITKVDIVHSMEVFYYLENPRKMIQQIFDMWLKKNGSLILGIDFYFENKISHSWPDSCGISKMKLLSQKEWVSFFKDAGFHSIKSWRIGELKDWPGTLVIYGVK
jgi:trans-aconitate methyltransferase